MGAITRYWASQMGLRSLNIVEGGKKYTLALILASQAQAPMEES